MRDLEAVQTRCGEAWIWRWETDLGAASTPDVRVEGDFEEEPTVEYTPRLSAARRRAKRVGKVSELPAVGAAGEDAALLYDVVATAELDAARTPPSTDAEECDDDDAALLMALKAAPCAS